MNKKIENNADNDCLRGVNILSMEKKYYIGKKSSIWYVITLYGNKIVFKSSDWNAVKTYIKEH